jgi:hypothetical protein
MTVGELMDRLQRFDPDTRVRVAFRNKSEGDVHRVRLVPVDFGAFAYEPEYIQIHCDE